MRVFRPGIGTSQVSGTRACKPPRPDILGRRAGRPPAVLRPPPVPSLTADADFLAGRDRAHPGQDQLQVERLGIQPPLRPLLAITAPLTYHVSCREKQ